MKKYWVHIVLLYDKNDITFNLKMKSLPVVAVCKQIDNEVSCYNLTCTNIESNDNKQYIT